MQRQQSRRSILMIRVVVCDTRQMMRNGGQTELLTCSTEQVTYMPGLKNV
jgi:hypothetical protein